MYEIENLCGLSWQDVGAALFVGVIVGWDELESVAGALGPHKAHDKGHCTRLWLYWLHFEGIASGPAGLLK